MVDFGFGLISCILYQVSLPLTCFHREETILVLYLWDTKHGKKTYYPIAHLLEKRPVGYHSCVCRETGASSKKTFSLTLQDKFLRAILCRLFELQWTNALM